jgi:hypothetical protein
MRTSALRWIGPIFVFAGLYTITEDFSATVALGLPLILILVEIEGLSVGRKIAEKDVRMRLERFSQLGEYESEAKTLRNLLVVITGFVFPWAIANYELKLSNPFPWVLLSVLLFSLIAVLLAWSTFVSSLTKGKRQVRSTFQIASLFNLFAALVMIALSQSIAMAFKLPLLYDTGALFLPFIALSFVKLRLGEALVFADIRSSTEMSKEMATYEKQIASESGLDPRELFLVHEMRIELDRLLPWIEELRGLIKQRVLKKVEATTLVREQSRVYKKSNGRAGTAKIVCEGIAYRIKLDPAKKLRIYRVDDNSEITQSVIRLSIVRAAVVRSMMRPRLVMILLSPLLRLVHLSSDMARDIMLRSLDETLALHFSRWLSTRNLERKSSELREMIFLLRTWEVGYASRLKRIMAETLLIVASGNFMYPSCNLAAEVCSQLIELIDQYEVEIRIRNEWIETLKTHDELRVAWMSWSSYVRWMDTLRGTLNKRHDSYKRTYDEITRVVAEQE